MDSIYIYYENDIYAINKFQQDYILYMKDE